MSTKALFWALEQKIPGGPKSVLIHLADWYNTHEDAAWPKHEQLAEKAGWDRRTIQRYIEWLVDHGFVVKEKQIRGGRQIQNRYRLSVSAMAFQGGQPDAARVDSLTQPGGQADAPINTINNTIKNTIICGEPQEDDLKISEVLSKVKKDRAEIFEKFKPTPKGCGDLWRDCRASASSENGFGAELLNKEFSMLNKARKRVSGDFTEIVWNVMSDWIGFTKHAEAQGGAFNCPLTPSIPFFVKFVEHAATFKASPDEDFGVKLTAKPLTKPIETVQTASKAASIEDVQAIAEKYGL